MAPQLRSRLVAGDTHEEGRLKFRPETEVGEFVTVVLRGVQRADGSVGDETHKDVRVVASQGETFQFLAADSSLRLALTSDVMVYGRLTRRR